MKSNRMNLYTTLCAGIKKWDRTIDRWAGILEKKTIRLYPALAGSVLFLALACLIFQLMPSQIKIRPDRAITARTFPSILAGIMLCGSLINLGQIFYRRLRKQPLEYTELGLLTEVKALILLLFLVIYAVLTPLAGFIPASVIYGILMLFYFRIKNWRYYIIVSVLAIVIGFLFKNVLNVRLP